MTFEEMKEKAYEEIVVGLSEEEKKRRTELPYTIKMMAREIIPPLLDSFNDIVSNYVSLKFIFDKIGMNEKTADAILKEAVSHVTEVFENETFRQFNKEKLWGSCENDYAENKEKYEEVLDYYYSKFDNFMMMEAFSDFVEHKNQNKEIHIAHVHSEN